MCMFSAKHRHRAGVHFETESLHAHYRSVYDLTVVIQVVNLVFKNANGFVNLRAVLWSLPLDGLSSNYRWIFTVFWTLLVFS